MLFENQNLTARKLFLFQSNKEATEKNIMIVFISYQKFEEIVIWPVMIIL